MACLTRPNNQSTQGTAGLRQRLRCHECAYSQSPADEFLARVLNTSAKLR